MTHLVITELPPFFERLFDGMAIPGNGIGLAISRTAAGDSIHIAIGQIDDGGIAVKTKGEERIVVRRKRVDVDELRRIAEIVDGSVTKSGILFAPDILDGEVYLVKRSHELGIIRYVLANPRDMNDPSAELIARQLDKLIEEL